MCIRACPLCALMMLEYQFCMDCVCILALTKHIQCNSGRNKLIVMVFFNISEIQVKNNHELWIPVFSVYFFPFF